MATANWRLLAGALALSLASVFAGALIGRLLCGTPDAGRAREGELPDPLNFSSSSEAKQALVMDAESAMRHIRRIAPKNPAVTGNCIAAMQQMRWFEEDRETYPLVVHARIQESGQEKVLVVCAINCHRETDQLIVVAVTGEGTTIRIVINFNFERKSSLLVFERVVVVRYGPVNEIVSSGLKEPSGEILVSYDYELNTVVLLPESLPLALAIRDRNGLISNFAPIIEKPFRKSDARGEANAPVAEAKGGGQATFLLAFRLRLRLRGGRAVGGRGQAGLRRAGCAVTC